MARKNKKPVGFSIGGEMYIRLDQVIKLIHDAGERSIGEFKRQTDNILQEHLDNGESIDVRRYKALKKENVTNLKTFLKSIEIIFENLEGEE